MYFWINSLVLTSDFAFVLSLIAQKIPSLQSCQKSQLSLSRMGLETKRIT